jgi:predicted transcriptional regulator
MNTVTLDLGGLEDGLAAFEKAWNSGQAEPGARISFASPDLLWTVLSAERWELLRTMAGQGPMMVQDLARRMGRDGDAVRSDVQALTVAGLLRPHADERFEFPFDAVHVDFMLRAA